MIFPKHISLLLLFVGITLPAQVSFKAVPDKTSAEVGEKIQLSFIITSSQDIEFGQVSFPSFAGFQMLGRNVGQSFNYTNGKMTKQYMETVVLLPQRAGKITVKGGTVKIDGKTYHSNPVTFDIVKAVERKRPSGSQMVFMDVSLTKNEVYPNEIVNAEVKLYAKNFDALRRRSDLEVPGMSDFQVVELTKNQERDFQQESINNQVFISEKIAVYQLLPSKSGKLQVPSFALRVAIPLGFFEEKIVEVKSKPITLNVKEFPPNAPSNFTGAVGDFKFITYLDPEKVNTNKSVNYEVEIVGEGNFSSIRLPKIEAPTELEIYPPKTRNRFRATASGEKGKLVDSYVIVPQYGGEFTIPSIELCYFDLKDKKYKTIATDEKKLSVSGKSKEQILAQDARNQEEIASAKDTTQKGKSILPELQEEITNIFNPPTEVKEDKLQVREPQESSFSKWSYALGLIPIVAGLLWFFIVARKKDSSDETSSTDFSCEEHLKGMKRKLAELKKAERSNDRSAFFQTSQSMLNDIVCYFAQEEQQYDVVSARKTLSNKKSDSFADRWETLYNQTQMMQYGVVSSDMELTDFYRSMEQLINELLNN